MPEENEAERRMRTSMREALDEILREREYQQKRWTPEHDKAHTAEDWLSILTVYMGKFAQEVEPYRPLETQDKGSIRNRLVQIGAVAAAAVEAISSEPAEQTPPQ
jgi:hypothetical protein